MTTGLTGMVARAQGGRPGFTRRLRDYRPFLLLAAIVLGCDENGIPSRADSTRSGANDAAMGSPLSLGTGGPIDYTPPSDSLIPRDQLGASIRRGLALITHTTDSLPAFAPGNIQCSNCHIDAGRRRNAAALIGVYARFPKYMDRTGAVIPVEDRVNYCFTRSLAGTRIPNDSREMQDIVAYLSFISKGLPVGAHVQGEGMPTLIPLIGDSARGAAIFATICTPCHGLDGQGKPPVFPALWGPKSYSIGASMAREERAATFIRHFMPQNKPGTLIDQQAYDVSAFINSHPRPDSPGKEKDWPAGGAPRDVPYNTVGHMAYRPPRTLISRMNPAGSTVQPPPSIIQSGKASGGAVPNQRTGAQ